MVSAIFPSKTPLVVFLGRIITENTSDVPSHLSGQGPGVVSSKLAILEALICNADEEDTKRSLQYLYDAWQYYEAHHHKKALIICNKAIEAYPNDSLLFNIHKAIILGELKRHEEAYEAMNAVILPLLKAYENYGKFDWFNSFTDIFFDELTTRCVVTLMEYKGEPSAEFMEKTIKRFFDILNHSKVTGMEQTVWRSIRLFEELLRDNVLQLDNGHARSLLVRFLRYKAMFHLANALRNYEAVAWKSLAKAYSIPVPPLRRVSLATVVSQVGNLSVPEGFGDDLAAIKAGQPVWEPSPWDS